MLFQELKDLVDQNYSKSMMRRTYDVVNILNEVGVIKKDG